MDTLKALSSLHCKLKIMNAKNIQVTNPNASFFVRCYLSSGNNKRVHLDSQRVSPHGDFSWNQSFALDCIGTKQSLDMIRHGIVVLELRRRSLNTVAFFGGSQLIGRAQVSWRDVFESQNMEMERWVPMKSKKKDVKAPSVRIAMNVDVTIGEGLVQKNLGFLCHNDESCGCGHDDLCNNTCVDSEFFIIGAAMDAI